MLSCPSIFVQYIYLIKFSVQTAVSANTQITKFIDTYLYTLLGPFPLDEVNHDSLIILTPSLILEQLSRACFKRDHFIFLNQISVNKTPEDDKNNNKNTNGSKGDSKKQPNPRKQESFAPIEEMPPLVENFDWEANMFSLPEPKPKSQVDIGSDNLNNKGSPHKANVSNITPLKIGITVDSKNTLEFVPNPRPKEQQILPAKPTAASRKKASRAIKDLNESQQLSAQSQQVAAPGDQARNNRKSKSEKPQRAKKIHKQDNYVRLNLKRKYQERHRGQTYINLRKYQRNGQLKLKYRKEVQDDGTVGDILEIQTDEFFNIYMASVSKALHITINLQDGRQEDQQEPLIINGTSDEDLLGYVNKIYGFPSWRFGQLETIRNILDGKSTLFVSETGSGKSLTYILASLVMDGLSIVISPLVSLMLDQIANMPEEIPAACISSLLNREQRQRIIKFVKEGRIKLLYMTPQALQTQLVYHLAEFPQVNFVCVDEAHSVSELSHNFRTTYLVVHDLIDSSFRFKNGHRNILCLTATANEETIISIQKKMKVPHLIRSDTFRKKNLCITVSRDSVNKYQSLVNYITSQPISKLRGILIYCRTRKITMEAYNYLKNSCMNVALYHAGLEHKQKTRILQDFRAASIKIVVATVALGMGLDFENVDCVIHLTMPKSIESYVQEIGRAGRRGRRAYAHLFLESSDYFVQRNFILAEQLDHENMGKFVDIIKKYTGASTAAASVPKYDLNDDEDEGSLKRGAMQVQQQSTHKGPHKQQEQQQQSRPSHSKICFANTKSLCQELDLKMESVVTILMKMQELTEGKMIQVLPPSYLTVKVSFYSTNKNDLEAKNEFFRNATKGCRFNRGILYIPLIARCNQMKMDPIHFLSKLQRLSIQHYLKIEYDHQVVLWRYIGETTFQDFIAEKLPSLTHHVSEIAKNSLIKLDVLYSLAFIHSNFSVEHILKKGSLMTMDPTSPKSLSSQFDTYFASKPMQFYNYLCEGNDYRPASDLTEYDCQQIHGLVAQFLRHDITACSKTTSQAQVVEKYVSGRILARLLLGVNTEAHSWKTYSQNPIWSRFKNKRYEDVLEQAKIGVKLFKEQNFQVMDR